jgi:hypothetical protein
MKGRDSKIGGLDKWEVGSALRTLNEAHKIKSDKKMMAAVGLLAKEEMAAMAHVVAHSEEEKK